MSSAGDASAKESIFVLGIWPAQRVMDFVIDLVKFDWLSLILGWETHDYVS